MNVLSLFAVLLLVTQAPVPIPRQASQPHTQEDRGVHPNSQHEDGKPNNLLVQADPVKTKSNQKQADGNQAKQDPRVVYIEKLPPITLESHPLSGSDWTLLVFNGLLVLVGAIQAFYVAKTLKAIDTQGTQMAEQTKVQRGTMKQWVELDGWQAEDLWNGLEPELKVTFILVNPTSFFLILKHAEIAFSPLLPQRYLLVTSGTSLPPSKPLHIELSIPLDTVRLRTFRTSTLGLNVKGTIDFASALEEDITQVVSGVLSCIPPSVNSNRRLSCAPQ